MFWRNLKVGKGYQVWFLMLSMEELMKLQTLCNLWTLKEAVLETQPHSWNRMSSLLLTLNNMHMLWFLTEPWQLQDLVKVHQLLELAIHWVSGLVPTQYILSALSLIFWAERSLNGWLISARLSEIIPITSVISLVGDTAEFSN